MRAAYALGGDGGEDAGRTRSAGSNVLVGLKYFACLVEIKYMSIRICLDGVQEGVRGLGEDDALAATCRHGGGSGGKGGGRGGRGMAVVGGKREGGDGKAAEKGQVAGRRTGADHITARTRYSYATASLQPQPSAVNPSPVVARQPTRSPVLPRPPSSPVLRGVDATRRGGGSVSSTCMLISTAQSPRNLFIAG